MWGLRLREGTLAPPLLVENVERHFPNQSKYEAPLRGPKNQPGLDWDVKLRLRSPGFPIPNPDGGDPDLRRGPARLERDLEESDGGERVQHSVPSRNGNANHQNGSLTYLVLSWCQ